MMLWTEGFHMFKFLRRTSLYILAVPVLLWGLGALSNQVVLFANNDKFPVMWSTYKVAQYENALVQKAKSDSILDPDKVQTDQLAIVALEQDGFLDDVHCVMTPETHLNLLADIFDLRDATYSIGDFMLMLSEWSFAFLPFVFLFDVTRKLKAVKD
jgi:hypothetical protein